MKKKDYKKVKDYVENKLMRGINNLNDAKEVYKIIYGDEEAWFSAGIDQQIWRWYTRNLDIVLEPDTVILTKVADPFEGDTITSTHEEDHTRMNFNPEKTVKIEDVLGDNPTIGTYGEVIKERIVDSAEPQMIDNELPKRWYLRNEFIDDEGNVFVKGKLKLN